MSKQPRNEIFESWVQAIKRRIGRHIFAKSPSDGGKSPLSLLLEAIYKKHFHSAYAWVEPPLQGLPKLPLDRCWTRLRVREEIGANSWSDVQIDGTLDRDRAAAQSVRSLLKRDDCITLLGAPGSGKSTILRWAARSMIREPSLTSIIPIYISLPGYVRCERKDDDIYGFFWSRYLQLPERFIADFQRFMEDTESGVGKQRYLCRVLLDGWDEVPSRLQAGLLQVFERFELRQPSILTSRPVGFVSSLPPWPRFMIMPLSFTGMRNLIHEWCGMIERPNLEIVTCRHLEKHLRLLDLARNPFVLTLLCAVVARLRTNWPTTRGALYRGSLRLIAKYCEEHKHEHGMGFDRGVMRATEQAAFDLLRVGEGTAYEFISADVRRVAGDRGRLFKTWKVARLIKPANELDGSFGFQHSTIHEYLAAQELCRRIARREVPMEELGLDAANFNLLTFAFGSSQADGKREMWSWLKEACTHADRFGVIFIKAAHWLAEAGEREGVEARLGVDVRQQLWHYFTSSLSPGRYVEALVTLDPEFAIEMALQTLLPVSRNALRRLMILLELIPVENRKELSDHIASGVQREWSDNPEPTVEIFHPPGTEDEPLSLSNTAWSDPELDLIAEERRERSLIDELKSSVGDKNWGNIVDALARFETIAAGEALFDAVELVKDEPRRLREIVQALPKASIDRHAKELLALVEGNFRNDVRAAAAKALGKSNADGELKKLVDFARLSETSWRVRKSVIEALALVKSRGFLHILWEERELETTRAAEEKIACIKYLGALARDITATGGYNRYFKKVEALLLDGLRGPPTAMQAAIPMAAHLRESREIAESLRSIGGNARSAPTNRAIAISSLCEMAKSPSVEELCAWLDETAHKAGHSDVAKSCASALARLAPEKLLRRKDAYSKMALWRLSLEQDVLIYDDRLVRPDTSRSGTPVEQSKSQAAAEVGTGKKGKKQKRKRKYVEEEIRRLYEKWKQKQPRCRTKENFANEEKLDAKFVRRALDRARQL